MLSSLGLGVQMPHCTPSGYATVPDTLCRLRLKVHICRGSCWWPYIYFNMKNGLNFTDWQVCACSRGPKTGPTASTWASSEHVAHWRRCGCWRTPTGGSGVGIRELTCSGGSSGRRRMLEPDQEGLIISQRKNLDAMVFVWCKNAEFPVIFCLKC